MDPTTIKKNISCLSIGSDSTKLVYEYLSANETLLVNQLLKVSLRKWYIIDKYIDEYIVCVDERKSYKSWIRLVRQHNNGPLFLKIQPFYVHTNYNSKFISYNISLYSQ
jgi:hypothetical protein